MSQPVIELLQPVLATANGVQLLSITTASATSCVSLPACSAVRIQAAGSTTFFSFTGSASASGSMFFLPANASVVLATQGGHAISFAVPASANPMFVGVAAFT